jgi:cation/acetate symporter
MLGTLGLPHILMRFMTVPDGRAARRSIGWAVGLIGIFYVLVAIIGLGGRAILGPAGEKLGARAGT